MPDIFDFDFDTDVNEDIDLINLEYIIEDDEREDLDDSVWFMQSSQPIYDIFD